MDFDDEDDARDAVKDMNGEKLLGQRIRLEISESKRARSRDR